MKLFIGIGLIIIMCLVPAGVRAGVEQATPTELDQTGANFSDLNLNVTDSIVSFNYGKNYGTTFTNVSGIIVSTPVMGDNNYIEVNFNFNLVVISGDIININLSHSQIDPNNLPLSENVIIK